MGIETPTPYLDEWQFKKVLAILRQERQAYLLTPFQKIVLRLLNVSVYLLFATIFVRIVLEKLINTNIPFFIFRTLLYLLLILSLLNLPLFYKILKQKQLMRRLGLKKSFSKEWQVRRRERKFIKRLINKSTSIVVNIVGLLLIIGTIGSIGDKDLLRIFFVGTSGFALITWPFLRLGKERLEFFAELTSLEDSLLQYKLEAKQANSKVIEIPADYLDRVARIEQSQISRDRAEAIYSWKAEASEGQEYALLKSRDLVSALARLALEDRLHVEDQIERLSSEPHPPESQRGVNSDNWRLRVPETSFEIVYIVDDIQRQIQITALAPPTDEVVPGPVPGGCAHA
jgi:hypothetical protein